MNVSNNPLSVLVDFASQIEFSDHQYVAKNWNYTYSLTKTKDAASLKMLVAEVLSRPNVPENDKRQAYVACKMIHAHLEKKISGVFGWFISAEKKRTIQSLMQSVHYQEEVAKGPSQTEGEARLKFYAKLPQHLRVKQAAGNDLAVIKEVSAKIWDRVGNDDDYQKYMKMFFEGEHILFEEEDAGENFAFYEKLKDMGAYLRGSSHYDHGTLNGKTGGPVPKNPTEVSNPQYEIEGPQVKALLFGRVKLALADDSTPIFGKTFDQARLDAQADHKPAPTKSKKYTFMQTEWAPDSSSFFTANYWKHRILSFCLYAGRKLLGSNTPNVGPYGYGHGDNGNSPQSQPTIIPLKK